MSHDHRPDRPRSTDRVALTAVVPTRNEERHIGDCLASLDWVKQRIVIDSESDDGTVAIARAHRADVIVHPFTGYGSQRNRAVAEADHDWILCIDADERVTRELRVEIETLLRDGPDARGYRVPRRSFVAGHPIRHCGWQRDRVLRLYDRRHGQWDDRLVHERVVLDASPADLVSPLLHYTASDFAELASKSRRYAELGAREAHRRGKRASAALIALSPLARWCKMYLLHRGFLDGIPGLYVTTVAAFGVFLKYSMLWQMQRASNSSDKGDNDGSEL